MKKCKVFLLDANNEVQYGLNWGLRENRDPNQAYLQLTPEIYKGDFFPPKKSFFVAETDDNETLFFTRAQKDYGCALQTTDSNANLGAYIRKRLGVDFGATITKDDIENYGRDNIEFIKIDDKHYRLNFGMNDIVETKKEVRIPVLEEPHQLIFYGAPGTGKSFAIDKMAKDDVTVRTTFHPDSDYASFVGAYKPTMQSVAMSYISEGLAKYAKSTNEHNAQETKIVYKYVPQAFLKAYVAAWSDLENPHYLVIEEINRGNCAQIFGDLFQLLDRNNMGSSSYAIHADEDIAQFLASDVNGFATLSDDQKEAISSFELVKDSGECLPIGPEILSGKKLLLPPNLYIWATMNTSDQSLFPIDSAFKRRWNWRYMPIDYTKKNYTFLVGDKRYSWGDFLRKMNPEISRLTESPDKQMGYFFAKPDKKSSGAASENDTISEEIFLNKVLFYLWTDVIKDFDATEPFVNPDTNRVYDFSDFFDADKNYLQQFVDKLGLQEVEIDEDDEEDELDDSNSGQSSRYKAIINSQTNSPVTFRQCILKITEAALTSNPTLTFQEIQQAAEESGIKSKNKLFMLDSERQSWESDKKENTIKLSYYFDYPLESGDGKKFYVSAQWNEAEKHKESFEKYAKLLNVPFSENA